jgi:acylphosphatase
VRNLPDGTVEVVVRATEEELEEIRRALEEGSPLSEVERIEMERLEEDDLLYDGFEIRY